MSAIERRALPSLTARQSANFRRIQRQWARMGETALEWAIRGVDGASSPAEVDRFLETGRALIDQVDRRATQLGLPFQGAEALDIGCGPGRLTQALAARFDRVLGIDVSPAMVRLATEINRAGDRCRFELHDHPDLRGLADHRFALTLSMYVLQHLPRWLQERYVREMVRVTAPEGTVVFQLHGDLDIGWIRRLPPVFVAAVHNTLMRARPTGTRGSAHDWEVHWTRPEVIAQILDAAGAKLVGIDRAPRPEGKMISYWYYARSTANAGSA
jgi:SAM-dependent methyltransferase